MGKLSPKRRAILDFIHSFIKERGYSPSVRDVVVGCGISSTSVAQYHLNVLEREGHISRDREVSRSIGLKKKQDSAAVPILGIIAAGKPIPVPTPDTWVTAVDETMKVPHEITRGLENVYALKVKGTSMVDVLIDDGDIVVMQYTNTAEDGETVAVWLREDQVVTLKRIYRETNRICLKPANKEMKPIYCQPADVEIQGKVIGVIRKL